VIKIIDIMKYFEILLRIDHKAKELQDPSVTTTLLTAKWLGLRPS
jgi:hypothetical protein